MRTHQPLTNPLDALLLPRVLRWVAVVFRQRSKCGHLDSDGRPWTRLPAKDLAAQLEREDGLEVSVRRVQRSLERLADAGYLTRRQRTKWFGQRDWWYSWTDEEWNLQQHRPTALARSSSASLQSTRQRRSETSVPPVQVLPTPSKTQTSLKAERTPATSSLDGDSPVSVAKGTQKRQEGGSKGFGRARGDKGTGNPLKALVERACALGGKPFETEWEPTVHGNRWIEHGYVFTRLESGQVVVDSLETAPLR